MSIEARVDNQILLSYCTNQVTGQKRFFMTDSQNNDLHDIDPIETQEWMEALSAVVQEAGSERAEYLLGQINSQGLSHGLNTAAGVASSYQNTISADEEPEFPADIDKMSRCLDLIRWNAAAMVMRAGKKEPDLGGHIATYASAAVLYEMGYQYFFRADTENHKSDLVYVQGHSSPGIYARAFLEGRLTEEQLDHFRQELTGDGLSSYPHPWLMPEFWEFPTVSMGLGPLQALYQAHFLKYMHNRSLAETDDRKIWAFCGDGEMDEPESLGLITLAARESLDNLIFVINCNLQRLDGPVRGNGKVIQELEGMFRGAGWNVIKVIWGSSWDKLFEKDKSGVLLQRMNEYVDGESQNFDANDGAYLREHFFGVSPELLALVEDMSDEELGNLTSGGHDIRKVYAAYKAATEHKGQPTVILARTIKGYGMGAAGESQNVAHNTKKMGEKDLKIFRDRFSIPIDDKDVAGIPYYRPDDSDDILQYIQERRSALGGYLPARNPECDKLQIPDLSIFANQLKDSGGRELSSTMAFVRMLAALCKDKTIGKYFVPIVADETRTFGMEGMFRQIGIYSAVGQLYEPVDKAQVMYYKETIDGQILQEGLSEAGAFGSWFSAATSYATTGVPMIPCYIYYSMFGFQRVGDFVWAAGDAQARGFLFGGTAGRTTLAGEGLQHQDGHSHLLFSVVPNCICYDPTFGYELAVIVHHGLKRMYENQENVFYYITLMNENYEHPAMPEGAEEGIIKGMYLFEKGEKRKHRVQLLGCGTIFREVIQAAKMLADDFDIGADIWGVTSFNELRRDALDIERHNLLHAKDKAKKPYVTTCLEKQDGPIIAATDYMKLFADQVRAYMPAPFYVLGTDGFGRSDSRKALRKHFEVNANMVAYTAVKALADQGVLTQADADNAMKKYGIDPNKPNPVTQ